MPECCYLRERHIKENEDTIKWLEKLGVDHNRLVNLRSAVYTEKDEFKRHKIEWHAVPNNPRMDLLLLIQAIDNFTFKNPPREALEKIGDYAAKLQEKYKKDHL